MTKTDRCCIIKFKGYTYKKIMVMIIVLYKFDSQYHVSGTLGTGYAPLFGCLKERFQSRDNQQ